MVFLRGCPLLSQILQSAPKYIANVGGFGSAGSSGICIFGVIGVNLIGSIDGADAGTGAAIFNGVLLTTLGVIATSSSIFTGGSGEGCVSASP